jgi:hypothetical protein
MWDHIGKVVDAGVKLKSENEKFNNAVVPESNDYVTVTKNSETGKVSVATVGAKAYAQGEKDMIEKSVINERNAEQVLNTVISDLGFNIEEIKDYETHLISVNEELEDYDILTKKTAVATTQMTTGVQNLNKNFEDYNDALINAPKNSKEYVDTIENIKTDLSSAFGLIDADFVNAHFIEEKAELLYDAFVNGSEDAQNALSNLMSDMSLLTSLGV